MEKAPWFICYGVVKKKKDFRCEIPSNITKITGGDLHLSQRPYIFGDPSLLDDLPHHDAEWVQVALMLGRKRIISECKASSPLPVNLWHTHLPRLAALEGLSYKQLNRVG